VDATQAIADALAAQDDATLALTARLAKSGADTLTGPINLNAATAILVGTVNDGLYLGNTGLVGRKASQTTFSITTTGDVTVKGDITGSTGQFVGSVSVNGATYANTVSGFWTGIDGGLAKLRVGDASQYLKWTGTNLEIKLNKVTPAAGNFANDSFTKSPTIVRSLGSITVTATGGTAPYTYSWTWDWANTTEPASGDDGGFCSFSGADGNIASASARSNKDCIIRVRATCTVIDSNGLSATISRVGFGTFGSPP
jgi:hypothetical protein